MARHNIIENSDKSKLGIITANSTRDWQNVWQIEQYLRQKQAENHLIYL